MKILLLTQFCQPEPFLKGVPFAKELQKLGHDVQILTTFPNYPGGKVYDGYRIRFFQKEILDGVEVIRVPIYPSHNKSGVKRFFNYISFAFSAALIGFWLVKKADVMYVYNSPATVCFSAIVIGVLRRIPRVYDIQDLWPESIAASDMLTNKLCLWVIDRFCRLFYKVASKIVVLSPGYKEELIKRGVPENKLEVIYNWCDDKLIRPTEPNLKLKAQLGLSNHFNIIFAGNMGRGQALITILEAASILREKKSGAHFLLIGGGLEVSNLKQQARNMKLENLSFHKPLPISEISSFLAMADVLLVHLKDNFLYSMTIPSKTQAYMAMGKPILMGIRGSAAELVIKARAGKSFEPQNPQSLAQVVIELENISKKDLEKLGKNGREFFEQHLALKVGAKKFENVFKKASRTDLP